MPCRAPDVGERNEIVMSVSATRTRATTTALRMSALRAFEGYGVGFERWTDDASTAARALRLGGATKTGYLASRAMSCAPRPKQRNYANGRARSPVGFVPRAHWVADGRMSTFVAGEQGWACSPASPRRRNAALRRRLDR